MLYTNAADVSRPIQPSLNHNPVIAAFHEAPHDGASACVTLQGVDNRFPETSQARMWIGRLNKRVLEWHKRIKRGSDPFANQILGDFPLEHLGHSKLGASGHAPSFLPARSSCQQVSHTLNPFAHHVKATAFERDACLWRNHRHSTSTSSLL
ncbi:hypothetical protein BJX64DRAFT_40340 [Aspergillus heterothallicus]